MADKVFVLTETIAYEGTDELRGLFHSAEGAIKWLEKNAHFRMYEKKVEFKLNEYMDLEWQVPGWDRVWHIREHEVRA